ncbi:AraC family transcriptional regulator, partial [Staphylococcus saprophyticus]
AYDIENKMLTAIQNGNIDEALNLYSIMKVSVSGIRRVKDDLLNQKYKAYLLNTLCRKSIEKAEVNLLIINELSAYYAAKIDDAMDVETLEMVSKQMISDYARTALNVTSLNYSSNINTVIQHIKIN